MTTIRDTCAANKHRHARGDGQCLCGMFHVTAPKKVAGYVIVIPERGNDTRRSASLPVYFCHVNLTGTNRKLTTTNNAQEACRFSKLAEAKTSAKILNDRMGWTDTMNHPAAFPTEYYE